MTPAQWEAAFGALWLDADPAAALARIGGEPRGWLLYRNMVRTRLRRTQRESLPRTLAALGADALDAHTDAWIESGAPRSRIYREVPLEFGAWLAPRLEPEARAALDADCAVIRVRDDARVEPPPAPAFALDGSARITPVCAFLDVPGDGDAVDLVWRSSATGRVHSRRLPRFLAEWLRRLDGVLHVDTLRPLMADAGDAAAERLDVFATHMAALHEQGAVVAAGAEST